MHRLVLFFLTTISLFTNVSAQTVLKGNFNSFPSTEYRIVFNKSPLNEYQGETLAIGKTNAKGEFSSSFSLASEQPGLLFIADQIFRLWVIPNTVLNIDESLTKGYQFTGQAAAHNNFLYQAGIMQPVPGSIASKNFDASAQNAYLDSIEKKRWLLYEKYIGANKVSGKFVSYCKGEITYFSFFQKSQYPARFIYMDKTLKPEEIPSAYYDFWKQFKVLDDSCGSDFYHNALRDFIEYTATKELKKNVEDKEKFFQTQFKVIDSLLVNRPFTKQKQKAEMLSFLIDYFDLPQLVQAQLTNYQKEFPFSLSATAIQEKWNKKNKNTFTTPDFTLKDITGKEFSIQSLRGKVVYIDFWGSWCKACLAQMPNSFKLQQKYKGKNVAFLFIDFYDTKEKWLKAIKDRKITGLHVKAEKKDEQYFNEKFGIEQGFPRYALLDKNGMLITSSAPHPNDKDLVLLIDKYLNNGK